jgi:hypothetical protein
MSGNYIACLSLMGLSVIFFLYLNWPLLKRQPRIKTDRDLYLDNVREFAGLTSTDVKPDPVDRRTDDTGPM